MKYGSWEEFWYAGEPSPMEKVVIRCKRCGDVMGYHETEFRPITRHDIEYMRKIDFCYVSVCYECWTDDAHNASQPEDIQEGNADEDGDEE